MKPGPKPINKIGWQFGRWTVVSESHYDAKGRERYWNCRCKCGTERVVRGGSLQKGLSKSCGCLVVELQRKRLTKAPGHQARNAVLITYKRNAAIRGIAFLLLPKEFFELTQQACDYCGLLPSNVQKSNYGTGDYIYNGIDRIDSALPYVIHNVVPSCKNCNRMKGDLSRDEFITHISRINNHASRYNNESFNQI